MTRRKAPKNLSLYRAVYVPNARTLQQYLNAACEAVASLDQREVAHPSLGTLRINHHMMERDGLFIHLIAKVTGESASTVTEVRGARNDNEALLPPPANRSFKNADLFALIRGNHLTICTDGVRVPAFEYYLKNFLPQAGQSNNSVMFEIKNVQNAGTVAILQRGGVKEIKLTGTLFNATVERLQGGVGPLHSMSGVVKNLKDQLASVFEKDESDDLAEHADQLQVEVVVKARGGSRAEEVVLQKMESVGIELLDDLDNDVGYQIKTNNNKTITPGEMVIHYPVVLERGESSNSLYRGDVFDKLVEAMSKFEREGDLEL